MIERSSSAMPKTAFFVCFLFCGNFILSGKTAEQCPKNPLSPTNSVSGMVVGTIVGAEKLVNGVMSYFYYLGENSVNQVIGVTSKLGDFVSKYAMKLETFASGLVGGVGGQIKSIYNASTGSIRVLFDYMIKMENSAQSFVYKQVHSFSDKVVSGNLTGEITEVVKNPFRTIMNGLKKAKEAATKLSNHVQSDIKKVVDSVKTSGVPNDVKDILGAPLRGVKEFMKEAQSAVQNVKNETSEKFSGYASEFKNGGVIDKLVAVSSVPVGATKEIWSFTLKMSTAAKSSVSMSVKDVVQPFLGQVLTERLGKIVNLPLDLTEGLYKSTVNAFHQVGGVISRVTGGGSVGDQINKVMKHPLTIVENAWNTTKQEIRDFSKASLGEALTEQLGNALSSPGEAISGLLSSLTNGKISIMLSSLIDTPMMYLKKIWSKSKMTIGGIFKGIIGEKWTTKISEALSSPGKFISDAVSSITGGGSLSVQIKTVLTQPLQTIKKVWGTLEVKSQELVTSITGGGSLSTQIATVLTKPLTLVKNVWSTAKKTVKSTSNTVLGESLTEKIGQAFTSPLATLSNATASITGGGNLSTQIKMVLTKPLDVIKNVWNTTKNTAESLTETLLGDDVKNNISHLFSSPLQTVSKLYNSFVSKVSGFAHGFGASISISGDASGGGGGGVSGAIKSFIKAPSEVLKGTFNGLVKAEKSLISGIKGFYHSIPIIGKSRLKIEVKGGNKKGEISIGGDAKAKGKSEGKAQAKAEGGISVKGNADEKSKQKKR